LKKAFTLIELLVVIAIIAILAAILFPVFAQAKAAAKATASLSNTKQQQLGAIMYGGDYDDVNVLGTAVNTGNDQICFGGNFCISTWAWSAQPYMKNAGLFSDPLASKNPSFTGIPQNRIDTWLSNYGYNYVYLSSQSDATGQKGVSATAAANPADTVMIVSKYSTTEAVQDGNYWFSGDMSMDAAASMPADCATIPYYCFDNWGVGSAFGDPSVLGLTKDEAGKNTGGNSFRATKNSVVGFLDGHAKKMSPGALAAGTNWTPTTNASSVTVVDRAKYIWDLE
jgi:prepilin-type N-terminal cleavage/methylation domain-containing protein